jgi:hypothetical protein
MAVPNIMAYVNSSVTYFKSAYYVCKLPTVIINGTLMRTSTSAAPHTSSSSHSSTTTQKQPFYMARLQHCTDSCSTHCCDMLCLPVSHRVASCTVTWDKR